MPCDFYTVACVGPDFCQGKTRYCSDPAHESMKSGLFWWQGMFVRRPDESVSLDGESDDAWSSASSDEDPDGGEMQLVPGTDLEDNSVGVWTHTECLSSASCTHQHDSSAECRLPVAVIFMTTCDDASIVVQSMQRTERISQQSHSPQRAGMGCERCVWPLVWRVAAWQGGERPA